MRHWGASGRHTWAEGYPSLGTAPWYSLNLPRVTWISIPVCTGCSPQCPQGALQLERSPCSHKPAKELLLMQTEPWQQQAVPKAGIALQQGVSGCCQGDRVWCQLWRCKGLQLPRGVEQHPLPEGREQRRGRRSIPVSKLVTFGSLCNLHSYRSKSTPEGKQRES